MILQNSILKTLAYADIFDYPLTIEEIWRWLIVNSNVKCQMSKLQLKLQKLIQERKIQELTGFYFLKSRKKIVAIRQKRENWSQEKFKIAQRATKWLKLIPTIKMAAITGALAMNNVDKNDDIDILIVTKNNRLWLTRFLTVFLIELVAKRRHPGEKKVKDKICLNMFLDEKHLAVPEGERNLYSAHEVCQLKRLWDKDGIHQKFLAENQWIRQYLPNYDFKSF